MFEENNPITPFNVLYVKKINIYPAYVSKQDPKPEKQVIILMVANEEEWHYLPVKKYLQY